MNINPGLPYLFPWLSLMAQLYESYIFHSLKFEFQTTSATTAIGSLILAVDFDAADNPPSSKTEMLSYEGAVRTAPWESVTYTCSMADLRKFGVNRYVRSGVLAPNLDIKTYDVGNLFIGAQGMQTAAIVGELYVHYDVTLQTPQFAADIANQFSSKVLATGNLSNPLTGATITGSLPIRLRDGNSIWFDRAGEYILEFEFNGTDVNTEDIFTIGVGSTVANGTSAQLSQEFLGNVGGTYGSATWRVNILQAPAYVQLSNKPFFTLTQTIIRISPYQYSLA
nr:MAG: coat protein [Hangzhou narna-like virus 2]